MENFHDKLADMTKAELESLFNDEEKIRSMVHDSPSVKQMEATKNRLMKSNQQKASMNLKSEPQMEKVREDLIAAHHDFSETLKEYTNYKSKLDEINGSFSTQTMLALMKVANAEEDELSDKLQKDLMDKKKKLDEFLIEMYKIRRSFNLRRIKIDKLVELENSDNVYRCAPRPTLPPQIGSTSGSVSYNRTRPYPKL